jgi:hypothetical protein
MPYIWTSQQPAGNVDSNWYAIAGDSTGSTLIACVYGSRVYLSIDSGSTWNETRPTGGDVDSNWWCVASNSNGSILMAGIQGGRIYLYSSSTWNEIQPAGIVDKNWSSVACSSNGSIQLACVNGGETLSFYKWWSSLG